MIKMSRQRRFVLGSRDAALRMLAEKPFMSG